MPRPTPSQAHPRESSPAAWRFVLGCWLIECLLWGLPLSFGVFQAFYQNHPLFASSKSISTIGDLTTGFSNFGFPFISPICLKYPQYQRHIMLLGWCGCVGSLFLASFATSVGGLMITQGVLYGISWPVCYTPFLLMINEWFTHKRGSVYGIIYGASGLGGIVLPFMLEKMLAAWDFRVTLRVVSLMMIVISGPTLVFVKPPAIDNEEKEEVKTSLGNFGFIKDRLFWVFAAAALVQGLSFYLPRFYLPSYAHALGLSHSQGATILAAYNLAQVSGQMGLGYLSDKVNIFIPVVLSTAVPAFSSLILRGPAKSFAPLCIFSLLCGSFGAAFSVLWARMSITLSDDPRTATLIFGVFICERGIANGLAGPISELLTGETLDLKAYGLSKYIGVIIFVGVTSFLAALSGLGYFLPRRKFQEKDDAFEAAFAPLHELGSLEALLNEDEDEGLKGS